MSFQVIKGLEGTITTLSHLGHIQEKKISKFKQPRFKNAKQITYEQSKNFIFSTVAFCSNIMCLFLTFIFIEFSSLLNEYNEGKFINDLLHFSAASAVIFMSLAFYSDLKIDELDDNRFSECQLSFKDKLWSFAKLFVAFSHPSQHLSSIPQLNQILSALSYLRVLFIYSYLTKGTKYYGTRPGRILSLYGHKMKKTSINYSIKCLFKEQGMVANISLLLLATVFSALIVMTLKGGELLSQVYLCLVTMTTVGYGDESVDFFGQRIILVIVIILGSFASSVLTVFFIRNLQLEQKQEKAYRLIKRLNLREKIITKKQQAISSYLNLKKINSRYQWRALQKEYQYDKCRIHEIAMNQYYRQFCKKIKVLVERQLLSHRLLNFFIERRKKFDLEQEKEKSVKSGRRRADDSSIYLHLRKSVLAQN